MKWQFEFFLTSLVILLTTLTKYTAQLTEKVRRICSYAHIMNYISEQYMCVLQASHFGLIFVISLVTGCFLIWDWIQYEPLQQEKQPPWLSYQHIIWDFAVNSIGDKHSCIKCPECIPHAYRTCMSTHKFGLSTSVWATVCAAFQLKMKIYFRSS